MQFNLYSSYCELLYYQIAIQIMSFLEPKLSSISHAHSSSVLTVAAQILSAQGPTLDKFNEYCNEKSLISSFTCSQFINRLENLQNKEIKLAGVGREALLSSFSSILLVIGCKQIKYYPHLLTLIRQQFFKPGVFTQYDTQKRNRILSICRNIEIQLISSGSVYQFLETNQQFLTGFVHLLNKIVIQEKSVDIVEAIRKRFNIDCATIDMPNSCAKCWILGMQRKIYLFEQKQTFIIVSSSTSTQPTRTMNQSHMENRVQSQRSVTSDIGQQVIIQASQQSTPKFKQNQQSIRYRKKSHKNSFGGDFQITGYKQLANLINKSQAGFDSNKDNKDKHKQNKKVFSQKFQMQQMGCLTLQDSPNGKQINGDENTVQNHHDRQFQFGFQKNEFQMRGSDIQGYQGRAEKREVTKGQRKKHITSSQIFEMKNNLANSTKNIEQNNNIARYNNQNANEINNNKVSFGEQTPYPNKGISKENFKISFSKNDSQKFVFKQIESEYNDNEHFQQAHKQLQKQASSIQSKNPNQSNIMRNSLTNYHKSSGYDKLSHEAQYLMKRQGKRRSLLLQSSITPIVEQVQSSQQQKTQTQKQSIAQSQRQRDLSNKQFEGKENQNQLSRELQQYSSHHEPYVQNNGHIQRSNHREQQNQSPNKNYINIFKQKNRKFSYLTQPISTSKNSLFGGNNTQLRQSYMDQAIQVIPESVEHKNHQKNNQNSPTQRVVNHIIHNKNKSTRPKIHKNSQAITQSKNKRRFEQNPISFSQMIANINGNQESNFSGHSGKNNNHIITQKKLTKLTYNSALYQFNKNNIMCYNEPEGWIRKQVIYYFNDSTVDDNSKKPQRYIIDRSILSTHFDQISQQSSMNQQANNNQNNIGSQYNYEDLNKINNSHITFTIPYNTTAKNMTDPNQRLTQNQSMGNQNQNLSDVKTPQINNSPNPMDKNSHLRHHKINLQIQKDTINVSVPAYVDMNIKGQISGNLASNPNINLNINHNNFNNFMPYGNGKVNPFQYPNSNNISLLSSFNAFTNPHQNSNLQPYFHSSNQQPHLINFVSPLSQSQPPFPNNLSNHSLEVNQQVIQPHSVGSTPLRYAYSAYSPHINNYVTSPAHSSSLFYQNSVQKTNLVPESTQTNKADQCYNSKPSVFNPNLNIANNNKKVKSANLAQVFSTPNTTNIRSTIDTCKQTVAGSNSKNNGSVKIKTKQQLRKATNRSKQRQRKGQVPSSATSISVASTEKYKFWRQNAEINRNTHNAANINSYLPIRSETTQQIQAIRNGYKQNQNKVSEVSVTNNENKLNRQISMQYNICSGDIINTNAKAKSDDKQSTINHMADSCNHKPVEAVSPKHRVFSYIDHINNKVNQLNSKRMGSLKLQSPPTLNSYPYNYITFSNNMNSLMLREENMEEQNRLVSSGTHARTQVSEQNWNYKQKQRTQQLGIVNQKRLSSQFQGDRSQKLEHKPVQNNRMKKKNRVSQNHLIYSPPHSSSAQSQPVILNNYSYNYSQANPQHHSLRIDGVQHLRYNGFGFSTIPQCVQFNTDSKYSLKQNNFSKINSPMCQVTHKSKSPLIRVASPTCRAYSTYTPATQHAYICTNAIHSPANRIANKLDNLGNTVTSPTISYPSVNFYKGAEKRSSGVTSPIYMQKMAHTIGS